MIYSTLLLRFNIVIYKTSFINLLQFYFLRHIIGIYLFLYGNGYQIWIKINKKILFAIKLLLYYFIIL